jgi:hypothetical protein
MGEEEILLTHVAKILARNFDALCEGLFAFTDPDTGVIELISRSAMHLLS